MSSDPSRKRPAPCHLPRFGTPTKCAEQGNVADCNIRVLVRTRPISTIAGKSCVLIDTDSSTISLQSVEATPNKSKPSVVSNEIFRFDGGVLDENISQQGMFDAMGYSSTSSILDGFNVTLFCYGQTGSGKTHTMYGQGTGSCVLSQDTEDRGFTVRIIEHLFKMGCEESAQRRDVKYRLTLSFLDIYDERVYDLFSPGSEKKVREGQKGVYVEGAIWKPILSLTQAYEICEVALRNRRISETKMNTRSSRSHTVCMIKVSRDQEESSDDGCLAVRNRTAVMTLVDLCGSERVKKSDVEGSRLKEAININSSLSALKSVITALGDGAAHIPYRESKLTWLLKECIGGNAKVYIVAHINPSEEQHFESLSTLRFVSFARTVRTRAVRNERLKTQEELLADQIQADLDASLATPTHADLALRRGEERPASRDEGTQVAMSSAAIDPRAVLVVIHGPDGRCQLSSYLLCCTLTESLLVTWVNAAEKRDCWRGLGRRWNLWPPHMLLLLDAPGMSAFAVKVRLSSGDGPLGSCEDVDMRE